MRKSIITLLLVGLFSLVSTGSAYAELGGGTIPTHEDNVKNLAAALAHLKESIASVEAQDKEAIKEHCKAVATSLDEINSADWGSKMERASGRVRIAAFKAKKGDFETAHKKLSEALTILSKLN